MTRSLAGCVTKSLAVDSPSVTPRPEQRLLLQFLEPSEATSTGDPGVFGDHLARALRTLPVTDLALGWRLSPEVIAAVRPLVPREVSVWRWVPALSDPGDAGTTHGRLAIGVDGGPPRPFAGSPDFRFLCPDREEVVAAALARAIDLAVEVDATGVMLDRIRFHSPSNSPGRELTCCCERSLAIAREDGLDLATISHAIGTLDRTLDGRRALVAALLGDGADGPIGGFLAWRARRITQVVARLVDGLKARGLETALDVFTPSLARSVGQDLGAIGPMAMWSKAMTYLDANGPAAMPYELRGYARWLAEAGDPDPAAFLADLLGFPPPGLTDGGPRLDALASQMTRLRGSVGVHRAMVGLDAVEVPGVCEVADPDLRARVEAVGAAGLGLAPSWELLSMSHRRLDLLAMALRGSARGSVGHRGHPT